jgi:hypothetical protein
MSVKESGDTNTTQLELREAIMQDPKNRQNSIELNDSFSRLQNEWIVFN